MPVLSIVLGSSNWLNGGLAGEYLNPGLDLISQEKQLGATLGEGLPSKT